MSDILYCVLHTHKYRSRYDSIMSTWGNNQNIIFYGDYEDSEHKNIIKVTDRDDYHSNEEKNINVFAFLKNNVDYHKYNWYFFCDNDTFVNTKNLEALINSKISIDHMHGFVANSWYDKELWYCGGGAGYLVSNKILLNYLTNAINYNTGFADVSVGINCKIKNIPLESHSEFNSFPPYHKDNKHPLININDAITFHYIKTHEQMTKIFDQIQKDKII
jgi:hypothetical protein